MSDVTYRYVGPGWVPGIPARDLTEEDLDRLSVSRRVEVLKSSMYKPVKPKSKSEVEEPAASAKAKKKSEAEDAE